MPLPNEGSKHRQHPESARPSWRPLRSQAFETRLRGGDTPEAEEELPESVMLKPFAVPMAHAIRVQALLLHAACHTYAPLLPKTFSALLRVAMSCAARPVAFAVLARSRYHAVAAKAAAAKMPLRVADAAQLVFLFTPVQPAAARHARQQRMPSSATTTAESNENAQR